jgi:RecA/RadA recombinase
MVVPQVQSNPDADNGAPNSAASRIRGSLPATFRNSVCSGRQLARANDVAASNMSRLPTTVDAVDSLLSGGVPRGKLVELIGKRSCGRFSVLLATLAATTRNGESAALVDMGNGLETRTAEAFGIDLRRLLWIRPGTIKLAMISAELALHAGLSLVAIDLGMPPVPGGHGTEAGWLRLARAADTHRTAVVVSSPSRVSSTAAAAVLTTSNVHPLWQYTSRETRLLTGLQSRFRIRKSRLERKDGIESLRVWTPAGEILTTSRPLQPGDPPGHQPGRHVTMS